MVPTLSFWLERSRPGLCLYLSFETAQGAFRVAVVGLVGFRHFTGMLQRE